MAIHMSGEQNDWLSDERRTKTMIGSSAGWLHLADQFEADW